MYLSFIQLHAMFSVFKKLAINKFLRNLLLEHFLRFNMAYVQAQ